MCYIVFCHFVCLFIFFFLLYCFFFFTQKTAYEMPISDWSSDVCSSDLLNLTRRLVALRAAHPALRLGANANWIAEGDLLGFDRVAGGEHVRCLFNLGGAAIDIAPHGAGAEPIVALNGADPAHLPSCGALWLKLEGKIDA